MANVFNVVPENEEEEFPVDFGEVTQISVNDFNKLENRPSYAGTVMTGDTNIPQVPSKVSDLPNDSNYQNANDLASAISQHNQSNSAHQDIRQAITDEGNARINADNGLQGQIDAITAASDVVDIVGTYAELQAYDTQHLKDNDVIKVLQDETHNDAMTYYRWSTHTETWTYIGAEGPYYTKSETNTLLGEKLDADEVPDGFFDGPATVNPTPATSVEVEDSIKLKSIELQGDTVQGANPTPSAPQTIQTVTGSQTITLTDGIVTEDYPFSLGSIELCKIGEYQDYIYKSGDDWYIHKETVKQVFDGTENWNYGSMSSFYRGALTFSGWKPSQQNFYNSHFTAGNTGNTPNVCGIGSTQVFMSMDASLGVTTKAQWLTWLSNNNVTMYTILATPTDTQITDGTLLGQLEALLRATIYQPATTITASGTLPAILNVEAFTDNLNSLLEIASQPDPEQITYSDFVGTDGVSAGSAGLVPAPATTDAGKFLKADGTWDTAGGGGPTVVQTTGTSQTDVMSQNAVTAMVYPFYSSLPDIINIRASSGVDGSSGDSAVAIGSGSFARGERSVSIGLSTQNYASGDRAVTIGNFAETKNNSKAVAIGNLAKCTAAYSVALGDSASATRIGEVNVGAGTSGEGYNSTNYRVLGGVHDGQLAQDAVTVNQVNATIDAINTALSTSIPHIGAAS